MDATPGLQDVAPFDCAMFCREQRIATAASCPEARLMQRWYQYLMPRLSAYKAAAGLCLLDVALSLSRCFCQTGCRTSMVCPSSQSFLCDIS